MEPSSSSLPTTPDEEHTNSTSDSPHDSTLPAQASESTQSQDVSSSAGPTMVTPTHDAKDSTASATNTTANAFAPAAFVSPDAPSEPTASASTAPPETADPLLPAPSVPSEPTPAPVAAVTNVAPTTPAASSPVVGQPVVNSTAGFVSAGGSPAAPSPGGKPRWLLPVAVVAALVVLGGGFVFGYYLPNQPSSIFNKSLVNSGQAVDRLVDFTKSQTSGKYSTVNLDGKLTIKSAQLSGDATLSGALDKNGNGNLKVNADIAGGAYTAEVRSIKKAGNDSPDIYIQATGFKSILDSEDMSAYDSLDGQWISVDHTLVDMYKSSVESAAGTDAATVPTQTQINDALVKVQTVNKQYLFSTAADKAVLVNKKFVAKEKMDGRSVDHFTTGYNKAHLVAYVKAMKSAFDSSSLPKSYKTTYDSAFDSLSTAAQGSKDSYTFDLYADTESKLVHAVTFTDPSDGTKITISQNYTGGDDYPFALAVAGKSDGQAENLKLGFSFNPKTYKETATLNADIEGTTVTGQFNANASSAPVTVAAPASSKPITDILNQLGLGGLTDSSAATSDATASDLFTLTQ